LLLSYTSNDISLRSPLSPLKGMTARMRASLGRGASVTSQGRWNLTPWLLTLLLLIVFSSCTPSTVKTEQELLTYIRDEDNGLYKKQNKNGVDIELMYRPTDLIVQQELQGKESSSPEDIQKLEDQYGKYAYFVLSFSQNDREALYARSADYGDFSEKLQRIAFRMNEYTYMSTDQQDTVYLSDFYYPRLNGMGMATQVLLAFEREQIEQGETATLHVKDLGFGTGRVNFKIKKKDMERVPRLELNNLITNNSITNNK